MAFREVKVSCNFKGQTKIELDEFFSYVQKTYIGSVCPIVFWNVHQCVLDNISRTNNAVEAWNRRFGILAESSHVPLYKLITLLQREEKHVEVRLKQRLAGASPNSNRGHQKKLDQRLHNLVSNYSNTELQDFVVGIAYNMSTGKLRKGRAELNDPEDIDLSELSTQPSEITISNPEIPSCSTKPGQFAKTYSSTIVKRPRIKRKAPASPENVCKRSKIM
ncbi:hypothetical protein Fcan01_26423 [Folsomia candida]|uniref:Uncharacterized protein n=1 Tax=Folsomia candida TaxID=158441 RepID=A0A226D0N9_FOLCA|nr:hypothetical protein Fcan01_26423 [Folsomia candida]